MQVCAKFQGQLGTLLHSELSSLVRRREVLPTCFVSPSPIALKAAHLTKVKDSTLLYIFYASPRLLIQVRLPRRARGQLSPKPSRVGGEEAAREGEQVRFLRAAPPLSCTTGSGGTISTGGSGSNLTQRVKMARWLCPTMRQLRAVFEARRGSPRPRQRFLLQASRQRLRRQTEAAVRNI